MPTFIKTGYWDKKAKAPDGWLDLDLFCSTHSGGITLTTSGSSGPATLTGTTLNIPDYSSGGETNIYNSNGTLTSDRTLSGNNRQLYFINPSLFQVQTSTTQSYQSRLQIDSNVASIGSNFTNLNGSIQIRKNGSNNLNLLISGYDTNNLNKGFGIFGNTILQVLATSDTLNNQVNEIAKGYRLDFANRVYEFGQINGNNLTTLKIDDAAAFPVQVSGTNVTQNTSGAASGKFLKIKVDGVDYVIELKNPS